MTKEQIMCFMYSRGWKYEDLLSILPYMKGLDVPTQEQFLAYTQTAPESLNNFIDAEYKQYLSQK